MCHIWVFVGEVVLDAWARNAGLRIVDGAVCAVVQRVWIETSNARVVTRTIVERGRVVVVARRWVNATCARKVLT